MTFGTPSNWLFSAACLVALLSAVAGAHSENGYELPQNFVVHTSPKPVAAIKFEDAGGQIRHLDDLRGKVVVLNVWATWCVPCRREMPTLDRLQAALGSPDFEVVPVSIDRGGIDTVRKFYADITVQNLAMYVDTSGQVLRETGAVGLPTTLIINREGQEVTRVMGPAEWDSAAVLQFLKTIVAQRDDIANRIGGTDAHFAEKSEDAPSVMQRGLHWLKTLFGK